MQITSEQINQVRVTSEQGASDAAINVAENEKNAKAAILQASADALSSFSELLGEHTAAGKAMAVASTIIDTLITESKIIASMSGTGPWGFALGLIEAATAAAMGAVRVKKILAVQVPGGKSVATPSIPGATTGSSSLPSSASTVQNLVQQQVPVKINADQVNKLGDRGAVRAYIVDADIQNSERRNQRIERASVLGG